MINTLKGSGTEKREGESKILKREGGKLGQGRRDLKKGGWGPLTNYETTPISLFFTQEDIRYLLQMVN